MFNMACVKYFPKTVPHLFMIADELDNPNSWMYRFRGGEKWGKDRFTEGSEFILKEIKKEGGGNNDKL